MLQKNIIKKKRDKINFLHLFRCELFVLEREFVFFSAVNIIPLIFLNVIF